MRPCWCRSSSRRRRRTSRASNELCGPPRLPSTTDKTPSTNVCAHMLANKRELLMASQCMQQISSSLLVTHTQQNGGSETIFPLIQILLKYKFVSPVGDECWSLASRNAMKSIHRRTLDVTSFDSFCHIAHIRQSVPSFSLAFTKAT